MKSKGHKAKPNRHADKASPPNAAAAPAPKSPRRIWLFRIIALLLPLFALLLLELVLRLTGYGYATGFFSEVRENGKTYLINNENFSLRFFPPELARWSTSFKFEAQKPADVRRIFVLGESAAMGDPQPAYSASRYLDVLLRERFPGEKFEIINLGITAINSHVIREIARDCAARGKGDLWIIYMGNNEMVGPFGAATVFGTRAPPLAAVRFNLAVQKTRIGQLFFSLMRRVRGGAKNTSWRGMEMFLENQIRPGDPRKETVYRNFEANLTEITQAGLDSGAKVVLSTMSVNLRDCPPFASMGDSNLATADRQRLEQILSEGKRIQSEGNFAAAAELFGQATKLDPDLAEAHYRQAECWLKLTNAAAPESFQKACDMDALPFRADTRINAAIRRVVQSRIGERFVLCDAEAALNSAGAGGVAGGESFFEHVHFSFAGNYRLARAWAEQVEKSLPEGKRATAPEWVSLDTCNQALGLSPWNYRFVLQSVTRRLSQPPLSTQFNNADRIKALVVENEKLVALQREPGAVNRVRESFAALIQRSPKDAFLFEGMGNFLEAMGDLKGAIAAFRELVTLLPHDFYGNLQLGRMLGEAGAPEQARPFLDQAVALRPTLPDGWHELGLILAAEQKFPEALECMNRAERIRPRDPVNLCYTGKVLAKMKRRPEAIDYYRRAIQMRPDFWEARFELAGELAWDNQINEALREYAEVIKINPYHATAHVNYGVILVRLNRIGEGIAQFEEALRLQPNHRAAQDYLSQVRGRQSR